MKRAIFAAAVCVLVLSFTGCGKALKEENARLSDELNQLRELNAALTSEKQALEAHNGELRERVTGLEAQIAELSEKLSAKNKPKRKG